MRLPLRSTVGVWALACALQSLAATTAATTGATQGAETVTDDSKAAAAAHRKAARELIQRERAAIAAQRQSDEAVCYQRFSVEDCLRGVRAQVRDAEARLRSQEIDLNDAERKERAADRLRSIEEKQKPVSGAASPAPAMGAAVRNAPANAQATKAQRDHDAELRAQDQRNRVQAHARDQSVRSADNADRAAKARARQAEVLKAAEARRARVDKSQAQAAAAGRKPAASLPLDSTTR